MKFDGVILTYGTYTDYLIGTNFPITTNDAVTWTPLITSDISCELSGLDKKEAFTIKILRNKVPNLANFLVKRIGAVNVRAVEIDTESLTWSEFYKGNVTRFKIDLHFIELEVESIVSLGLRSANAASGTVAGISGRTVFINYTNRGSNFPDPVPDNFLKYGKMISSTEVRSIVSNDAGSFTVRYSLQDLSVGDVVTVYAGCDKSVTTCKNKFDNISNYIGFPYVPTESAALKGRQGKVSSGGKK